MADSTHLTDAVRAYAATMTESEWTRFIAQVREPAPAPTESRQARKDRNEAETQEKKRQAVRALRQAKGGTTA